MKKQQIKLNPLRYFISNNVIVGGLLVVSTALSLIMANTSQGDSYRSIWNAYINYNINLPHSLLKWVNDFLMAGFFLFAGLEIKRELLNGELSSFKKAILPFGAAVGGMIVPALIFIVLNINSGFINGWGIPTATDIAFSIGIASLFGKRVPVELKIFLMALAIIDDVGAVMVIAFFYGSIIKWCFLLSALLIYGLLLGYNYVKVQQGIFQLILSLLLWGLIFNSGIEASISGVLIAFAIPLNSIPKFEKAIYKIVNFFILPLFAMANTAILIPPDLINLLQNSVAAGIIAGLVIGKPAGIFIFCFLMIKLNIAKLPSHTSLKQLLGAGLLAGIGFTMSIFIATLAFSDEKYRDISKVAILASLVISIIISGIYFSIINKKIISKGLRSQLDAAFLPCISLR